MSNYSCSTLPPSVVLNNKNYKILTPNGYEEFLGINKITKDCYIHLKFSNGKSIKCSEDHPISTIDGIIRAKDLDKKTLVDSKDGGCFVISKRRIKRKIHLYDIVNSGKDHLYYSNDIVSHNCQFLGSSDTLIDGHKLASIVTEKPIKSYNDFDIYENPNPDSKYIITVDVADGVKQNYSAFVVFDISSIPYRVVAKYRSNVINQHRFASIILPIAVEYNNAYILVEINKGVTVANHLHSEMEYENLLMCRRQGRLGQILGQGLGIKSNIGLTMDMRVKKQGCMGLKTLIEMDKLLIRDHDILQELCSFEEKANGRFEASKNSTDDLVITLVMFAWIVSTEYFKEISETDLYKNIKEEYIDDVEEKLQALGFFSNAFTDTVQMEKDENGDIWFMDEGVRNFDQFQEKLASYANFYFS